MTPIVELTKFKLDDELLAILSDVTARNAGHPFSPDWEHFVREVQHWMALGLARVWKLPGAVLGGVFTKNLFTGLPCATVMFWFAEEKGRGRNAVRLFDNFLHEARARGCQMIFASSYATSFGYKKLSRFYKIRGFDESETVSRKVV